MRFKDFLGRTQKVITGLNQIGDALEGLQLPRAIGKPARKVPGILEPIDAGRTRLVPVKNLAERVKLCRDQVLEGHEHPQIIELARVIVSQPCGTPQSPAWCIRENDKRGELAAVHKWVRANLRYVFDPVQRDVYSHPRNNIRQRAGDCDEVVATEAALLGAIGIRSVLEVVDEKGNPELHLVGVAQFDDGKGEVYFDPSVDKPLGFRLHDSLVAHRWRFTIFQA